MLRDVFYYGDKPNVHPREQFAENLLDARQKCITEHFWIISEFCDYKNFDWDFDFEFLPDEDVWAEDHNNVWPSQHQKDSGTWLCPKEHSDIIIYRGDVEPVIRKNEKQSENWVELDLIDHAKFDFSWHPDPTDPPYIYKWGCKFFPAQLKHVLEYRVPGATQEKYMPLVAELLSTDHWVEHQEIDKHKFDMSWRPNPLDPPYIYIWGNKYVDGKLKPTLEYRAPDATDIKYMPELLDVLPEWDRWVEVQAVDKSKFDFSWRPDPREPALIYVFGNEIYDAIKMPTVEYHCEGATERKYMDTQVAKLAPNAKLYEHLEDSYLEDYVWRPDPDSPPYIYVWGNQWNAPEDKISVQIAVLGATEYKYMTDRAIRKPCMDNWVIPDDVDTTGFDFSWEPSPAAPPYIYEFATQWQKTGGPQYVVSGATEKQYLDFQKVTKLSSEEGWTIPDNIDISGFDFSWHPDDTSPPYVYVFATQWAFSGGPVYTVSGATETKYVDDQIATATTDMTNWVYDPNLIDTESFDFSWHPYIEDQPYVYEFGTQWQKTGGPKYITPGSDSSSPVKYIDIRILKSKRLPYEDTNWHILNDYKIKNFDYSWHPDTTEQPYIYVFGNNLFSAEEMPTIQYKVDGATEIKYVQDPIAELDADMTNWEIPDNVDTSGFDFSWKPNPNDPSYIYEFGTQHQKTGGPRYIVPGATETKFVDTQTVIILPNKDNWKYDQYLDTEDFDFSWHPDATDPPYIYAWGNQWVKAEDKSAIEYQVPRATEYRYMEGIVKRLHCFDNWQIPDDIDTSGFDFSWEPSPAEEPYSYQFGTQWQKTGGPRYVVKGATEAKYIEFQTTTKLPNANAFTILNDAVIADFDYSWHPDETEEPYIYVFGNNQYPAEEMPTIEYRVSDATTVKYVHDMIATLAVDMRYWDIPVGIDTAGFDFSWKPKPNDPPYIYEFATQHQKTGGPKYVVPDATEFKYLDHQKVISLSNELAWEIPTHVDVTDFDFSWHPDATDPPYIYQFGTQWALSGGPKYIVEGATEIKYMDELVATSLPDRTNWVFDETQIDVDNFDFSWHPYVEDQPYIYEFGTQWQKTGGPKYITPGADSSSPTKYIDTRVIKAKRLPNPSNDSWKIINNYKIKDFDFSWHPDNTDEPYIYVFGNNLYPAEEMPTIEYHVSGAKQVKFVNEIVATLDQDMTNWEIPKDVDITGFDFSWKPNPTDPAYVYEFGTQHQKTGGPRYVVSGATETKYLNSQKVIKTSSITDNWNIIGDIDQTKFDFSWHPDATDPPYIYAWGNQWVSAEDRPSIEYVVPGATEYRYMDGSAIKLPAKDNWTVPENVDATGFDFSWEPSPKEEPYIYQFGTQWQKTGGPKYIISSDSPVKYVDIEHMKATRLPDPDNGNWVCNYKVKDFDFSWHPDETEEPYIYVFGNNLYPAEECATVEYRVPGAVSVKFISDIIAILDVDMTNWEVPNNVNTDSFDFSWIPNPNDPLYIYEFGTQHQKTGGPRYVIKGATEIKHLDLQHATILPNKDNWTIPNIIDVSTFDFSWHPDATEPAYIYQFGTQWALSGGPVYTVPGATETKYMDNLSAIALPNRSNWKVDASLINVESFDFSWHPYVEDQPYIYEFGTQHQKTGGPKYITPGAKPSSPVKYVDVRILKSERLPNDSDSNWKFHYPIQEFDFSWHPDETEEPYIYVFGNTQYPAEEMPTVEYRVPGAIEKKYISDIVATLTPNKANWKIDIPIDESIWDFTWIPNPNDPPYIYVWGNQWNPAEIEPTVRYVVEGATEIKYMDNTVASVLPDSSRFKILHPVVESSFDFSWRPNPKDPAYTYVFGNSQYPAEIMPTLEFNVPGATQVKYVQDFVASLAPNKTRWSIPDNIDSSSFDFSWVPDPLAPPYIYEFATVWNNRGGPKYTALGATEYKYIEDVKARTRSNRKNWEISKSIDVNNFDFSWVPHPEAPPYIYQFGTLVDDIWVEDGPRYLTPGNDGFIVRLENSLILTDEIAYSRYYIETTLDDLVREHPSEMFWVLNKNINYESFDFSWKPEKENLFNVTVFGSPDSETTHTYFVNAPTYLEGHTGLNFIEQDQEIDEKYLAELFVKPDMFFVDRSNPESAARFEALRAKFGTRIQKTRYLNSWVDTINRCINRSTTEMLWVFNSELDYTNFNFDYYPNPWQMKMVHVFGTQWSHWGTTFMVNRETFAEDTKYIKIIEHLSNLNFVKDIRAIATDCVYDVVVIDHGNQELANVLEVINTKVTDRNVTSIAYNNSYFDTLKDIIKKQQEKKEHYLWICSSVCDYTSFDFSYICDPYAKDQLHVFPSGMQKFGDTFFVDVNKARESIDEMEKLEDFHKVNFNATIKAKRLPEPVIVTAADTQVEAIKNVAGFPYATIITGDNVGIEDTVVEPMNLWSPESKNILITSTGGTRIVVPTEAKDYVTNELYEYPYIKRMPKLAKSKALDIVFVSNGELAAEQNYDHLCEFTRGLSNKIHRVDGINGRTEALHAAANQSETPWFFCVPAKLYVNKKFDWNYQADRLQMPKHYIFNAHNPVTELFYGHQSMVLYNKDLVLNNAGVGLDFTLDSPHMSVELNSGIVVGDTDSHSTWRTAFREAVKLKRYSDNGDEIAKQRLDVWTSVGKGSYGAWSIEGALDGLEFYDEVDGDLEQLRQSYYWDWLRDRYDSKY